MATIEEIRNLAEPLKGYQFRITISNPPGSGAGIDLMQFRCAAATIPGKQIEEVLITLGGYNLKRAGRSVPVGTWTVSFVEGTDAQISQRMRSWQEICHNQATGIQENADGYSRSAVIELLDNAGNVSQAHRLIGIWPQDIPDVQMDTGTSEAVRYDVTFAYDHHEIV